MEQPRWLELAWADLGVAEGPGSADNPVVVRYYADAGHPEVRHDDVAWCAAFVGACLERAGIISTRSLAARSYLAWGEHLDEPRTGAIAVLSRGDDPSLGHVGFLVGMTASQIILLGGNQGDAVSVESFDRSRLLELRWPVTTSRAPTFPVIPDGASAPIRDPDADPIFERALAHVLEMEGGFDEDPYDPGGPTNRGITLAEFVRDKGVELTSANLAAMKSELKTISPDTVRRIYRDNYWQAAACPALPPALALFHFDAAVNQGVGGAARMLQQAVGADIDGEIGPLTITAAAARPTATTLNAYAAIRRRRYRALPTFWRFGKGWLSRVDATLALAREIAGSAPISAPSHQKGSRPMTSEPTPPPPAADPKWWGSSITIWGVLITALSTVLPVVAPALGFNITAELIRQLGDNVVSLAQAIGGLIGTVMAIYGRLRASAPLERRQITLHM
jgi:uncharacterized protein (TIGR02594 family)